MRVRVESAASPSSPDPHPHSHTLTLSFLNEIGYSAQPISQKGNQRKGTTIVRIIIVNWKEKKLDAIILSIFSRLFHFKLIKHSICQSSKG